MNERLINIGNGLKISQPVEVVWKLKTGEDMTASVSHKGVIAVCECENSGWNVQLTNNDKL
eukprot:gnl/Chilomastix_caulleri/6349.p2 GENE.gnl/Chilomastix_caulleri/6349~~gnl/Chilomastix_caulleri/6349.p2  ORF type:complete len:61 (-),score=7.04 gnl/Chilomastix_caulleri/6349:94-276(-)